MGKGDQIATLRVFALYIQSNEFFLQFLEAD